MIFRSNRRKALLTSAAVAALMVPYAVEAQQITSAINGTITTPAGAPADGVTVTIRNTETGLTRTAVTSSNGAYSVRNLPVGGPYTVTIAADGFESQTVTDIFINVAGSSTINLALTAEGAGDFVEEITVSAAAVNFSFQALGPSSVFSEREIRSLPSISRNVNDILRIDPRVQFSGGGISCLGANNNFNAFTIDGVRSGDGFGLNGTGNLGRNSFPIPFDSVKETSVEFAPIDVQYGLFQGCQVNVITKSGTNEFHGSAFFTYNNADLFGDEIDGEPVRTDPFDRFFWGAELGGPIIEDKLFFYASYAEFSTADVYDDNPEILGGTNDDPAIRDFTLADFDRFADILATSYGRDRALLEPVLTQPETNRRFFGRIDWNISDKHRLEATYARVDESNIEADTSGAEFSFRDSFEEEGTASDSFSVRLYSDWTNNFSTDIRVSRQSVTDIQQPVGGGEAQAENIARISVTEPGFFAGAAGSPFFGNSFFSGPGVFRSANELNYETDQVRLQGTYVAGDHTLLFGFELDNLSVFNLFIPNATGTIFFDNLDNLESGLADNIAFAGSFSQDPNDAAASFSRTINSLYLQDNWQISDRLELVAGLRYDWYTSGDQPNLNPNFVERYGFENTTSFDGLDIFMPRIGLNYTLPEDTFGDTSISLGAGVFSVAGPTVWFANSFQNYGGAIGEFQQISRTNADELARTGCTEADFQVLNNGSYTGLPQCIRDAAAQQAQQNLGRIDAVDPNFSLPSQLRLSFGIQHYTQDTGISFFDDWNIQADFIYSIANNPVDYIDLTLTGQFDEEGNPIVTPDGRQLSQAVDPLNEGCNAQFIGVRQGFSNVTSECGIPFDQDQDILLTNVAGDEGRTINFTVQVNKLFQLGDVSTLDFRAGYAFSDVQLVNTGQNSTATTGFENTVSLVPNSTPLAPSVFSNEHAFTVAANFETEFVDGYKSRFGAVFTLQEGSPFSYVFDDRTADLFGDSDRESRILPYIPTGRDDPNVDFSGLSTDEVNQLFSFIDRVGLDRFAGGIAPRNVFRGPWNTDLDLRFTQELPGFFDNDRFELFIDLENVLNFIDSELGVNQVPDADDVPEGVPFIRAGGTEVDGRLIYRFTNFEDRGVDNQFNPTLWRVNLGIRYQF